MNTTRYYRRPGGKAQVSLLLPEELIQLVEKEAEKEHRSRNKQVEHLLRQWYEQQVKQTATPPPR